MLKRFTIQTRLVRTPKKTDNSDPTMADSIGESSARLVNELAKDFVKYAAGAVLGAVVLYKAADTVSQIVIKKTKSADNDK
jgi:hypothetical protein